MMCDCHSECPNETHCKKDESTCCYCLNNNGKYANKRQK